MKKVISPEKRIKSGLKKNWDAILIFGVVILIGAILWKIFPTIEEKIIYNKNIPETPEHAVSVSSASEFATRSNEVATFSDKVKDFLGIRRTTTGKTPEATREAQKEQDVITQDKIDRMDETLQDIKDRLREDRELRSIP